MGSYLKRGRLKRLCSLSLAIIMTLSLAALPASATAETEAPATDEAQVELQNTSSAILADLVDIMGEHIDGEEAFDFLTYVYLGWRTTGSSWQNQIIKDFVGARMDEAGYVMSDKDLSWEPNADDFFYVQHDASSSPVWSPEYARLEITSIKDGDGEEVEGTDADAAHHVFDVESYAFDPTSDIYQAYYNVAYGLNLDLDTVTDTEFAQRMADHLATKEEGKRVYVFPEGTDVGAARGKEAELNKRAHLTWNTSFNATADEISSVREAPANVRDIVKGQTGAVVYVGGVRSSGGKYISDYEGDEADLAGKVLLCDSSNRSNFNYARQVGAISVMTTASMSYFLHPAIDDTWYGAADAAWYDELAEQDLYFAEKNEWYSDSARYASGAGVASAQAAMDAGQPVVEWNISKQQYAKMRQLLDEGYTVEVNAASLGSIYNMNTAPGEGQLTAIAEIKGSKYPDERVVLASHVQEPSSNDNATGVALNLELATKMKQMVDDGILPRPERTITFLWGDEMQFSSLYLDAHKDLIDKIVCSIDLDMVGEDTNKTGGPMRIEKAPDPSAYYNYLLDTIPEDGDYLTADGSDPDGNFTRIPDSHTLWGAGNPASVDIGGIYLNDLYMAAAQTVIDRHNPDFRVDVCPYEGGSDHTRFLQRGVPAVLTWHFTDYVYHTTVDTLYMSSAQELEDVGITSLATAYMTANPSEDSTVETMEALYRAARDRFEIEKNNSDRHVKWTLANSTKAALANELEQEKQVLNDWADWYVEAIQSCGRYLDGDFPGYASLEAGYIGRIEALRTEALTYAEDVFSGSGVNFKKATLALDETSLFLDLSEQKFTATLTVDAADAPADWTAADWASWAKGLNWYLTRKEDEGIQDPGLYPYIYTGDKLQNWTSWGTNSGGGADGKPYFTVKDAVAVTKDGETTVTLDFSHGTFFEYVAKNQDPINALQAIGSSTFRFTRNVWGSFIGDYRLSVRDGSRELASTKMSLNTYDSYRRYDDLHDELVAIAEAAAKNGRYFDVRSYGKTTDGNDQWCVVVSDSEGSVTAYQDMHKTALTDPASLQKGIKEKTLDDYRVPVIINNVHPDEGPAPDAPVNLLWSLATEDEISWNTITGLKDGSQVDKSMFDPKLTELETEDSKYAFTGYGLKVSGAEGNSNGNDGRVDASEFYTFSDDKMLKVDDILDNIILIVSPTENPDGRTYNTRPNANGFDLNRDCSNQTQPETTNMAKLINEWDPVAFIEFHGFTAQFLVEPCTPPHEPNLEYDLLVKNFLLGAEAFGNAALATLSTQHKDEFELKVQTYYTPLRDNYDPDTGWDAWDDLNTNYTPSYAMLNAGSMGFTIETPAGGQAACSLLEGGMYGILQYFADEKDDIYYNQLEFFRRGIKNEDHRKDMEVWYVDQQNEALAPDTWRVPNQENNNYFPEYWVIPVDRSGQRDPAGAWEMAEFLTRNGVKVSQLTEDVEPYHKGDLVVDMHQAKRNYANCVLWAGCDASASGFPDLYSESVSNFPEMRGFTAEKVTTAGKFDGKLATAAASGESQFSGVTDKAVVLSNNGEEAVRAVNQLLAKGKAVGLITDGDYRGDFVVSYTDYQTVARSHVLVATGVSATPIAYQIRQPKVYLIGRYAPFANNKVNEGYYTQWFSQGFGYYDYQNIHNNGTSAYDVMAYDKQLGFTIVDDPAQADVILGSVALNNGEYGAKAVEAVKAGTPYISTGSSPLSYLSKNLVPDLRYRSLGMESLHHVTYPSDSLATAPYVASNDYIAYSYNCTAITELPEGAQVLIQAAEENSHIAGCCLTEDGKALDGKVEAIALERDGMDLTIFANSIVNRAHQQDDYRYVTTTLYSKCLDEEPMVIEGVANVGLTLNKALVNLSGENQPFTATLVVDAETLDGADVSTWVKDLKWSLTREGSEQDPNVYPNCYTGDELANWQLWNGGKGGTPMFTLKPVSYTTEANTITVTLEFTAAPFFQTDKSNGLNSGTTGNRNVWESFIGHYNFAASAGGKTVGSTDMMVNMYEDYTRYDDVYDKLLAIQAEAADHRRYLSIIQSGHSEGGRDQYYAVLSDSKASVDAYQTIKATAETDPASLQAKLKNGKLDGRDYRVPFLINNVHPDECPGSDAHLTLLHTLATQDTISYKTLTGFKDESVDISTMFAKDVLDLGITGLGSQKFTANEAGKIQNNTGVNDANELYTISGDKELVVDDILDDLIFISIPNENPDGRTYNSRRNDNGFDLNRDASNQTQSETKGLSTVVNDWNPVVFAELHGYMGEFLVEPCTPPHEPNLEYDLLVKNFMLGAEAFGKAALGTISGEFENTKYWSYYTPLRDDYDPKTMTWSAWDDLCTNYGPSYAMLNCGSLGYTIETPYNNEASTKLFEYGIYGLIDYVMQNKDDIYSNQLEFFRRGTENIDARDKMEKWYVDVHNNKLESDTWRVPYEGNDNYFPEYYVIPVDSASQRDIADAYEMGRFLLHNGVQVSTLDKDTQVDGVNYLEGSLIVDMHQAKRNYANAVLWTGASASASGFPDLYSESVSNFPEMRGFDCIPVDVEGAFAHLTPVDEIQGKTQFSGVTGKAVVLSNNGQEAVRAVNALLDAGKAVGMITKGDHRGDFLVSYYDYLAVKNDYVLSATGVGTAPVAYAISRPTIYLAGRYDPFSNYKITEGYFADWFSDGYGFINYRNVHSNGISAYDVVAYDQQLGFTITDDPAQADIILGAASLSQGEHGEAAVAAVKAGTPYIATGTSPLSYISKNLVTDLAYQSLGMEALHSVTYPSDSLITASYAADGDFVTYSCNCGVLTQVPEGAQILIRAADEDSFIAGCALNTLGENETSKSMDGLVEAIALVRDGMDLTIFANSVNNRAHQQDDYRYVTNAIYSKMLADTRMVITGVPNEEWNLEKGLTLNKALVNLSGENQPFTATLVVDAETLDGADVSTWVKDLKWSLTREGSEQDPNVYPNCYTGDELANWQLWNGGKGGTPMFTLKPVSYTTEANTITVTLEFTAAPFFQTDKSNGLNSGTTGNRNVWESFIGHYNFAASAGGKTVGSTDMMVNMYEDYTRYDDVYDKLLAIQAEAADHRRYLSIIQSGHSEGGRDQYYAVLSDSKASVDAYQTIKATAETDPASLQAKLKNGKLDGRDYRVPFLINNVHPDECPGSDAHLTLLHTLATQDTISYKTLTGFKDESVDISTMFAKDVLDLGITGLGSQKFTANEAGKIQNNTGVNDANELYTISGDKELVVDDILDDLIFISIPNENPDGRTYNSRRNDNGFDLNRDASNQTQSETKGLSTVVNDWNPVVFAELHGYMGEFLVEPCTPPHEPNLEYDLLVKNFMLGAEAFGKAALGTISGEFENTKYWSYYTPLRDDYDPKTMTWSAWDDLCTNYGPSYAMLNCGSLGYTIETPYNNEASTKLFEYGIYGLIDYVMQNKDDIYSNQLEFFRRGTENIDARDKMEKWYVDVHNNKLESDTWRVPYEGNDNYFPEYYVIPVDSASQRDIADAYEMGRFLLHNGVQVSTLDKDTQVDGVNYLEGSLIVDMHQAKRNYANAVLWTGASASASGFPDLYSESVSNFPEMRGFDCIPVDVEGAFAHLTPVDEIQGKTQFSGVTGKAVVLSNNGQEAVRAVNALLDAGKAVGMITKGDHRGDFLVSYYDYLAVKNDYVLSATGVGTAPVAYAISRPTIYLAGRYDPFSNYKITEGYFADWFSDGYGFINYRNVHSNGISAYDVVAYDQQLGFTITDDPAQADIILGAASLSQGEHGEAAVAAVKAGTPYIATGTSPLSYISKNLVTDLAYQSLGMEALHSVTYPSDSLITASYAADGDFVTYSCNCGVLTQVPEGAQILIRAADEDSFIAGCALNTLGENETSKSMDGLVEAIALVRDGMDLTIFANSVNNRAHQQDDYRYVTNAIYSKMLADTKMSIAGVPNSGSSSGSGGGSPSTNTGKTTVKNDDGSTTVTVTDKKTDTVTATTTYPDGTKAETVTTKDGAVTGTVTLPKGKDTVTVTLPVSDLSAGTVVKVVNADGTETLLPWSVPVDGGLRVTVSGSGSIKLKVVDNAKSFNDVSADHWASQAVQFVTSRELFLGTGDGTFSPTAPMSRAMLVTVLHRLQGKPAGEAPAFPDVPGDSWYADAVAWAAANDIVKGTGQGFDPEGNITRESLSVMLYRYAQLRGMDVTKASKDFSSFTDGEDVSDWAAEAMRWAVGSGILSGKDGSRLDPAGTATRAEVATMLMRFLSL